MPRMGDKILDSNGGKRWHESSLRRRVGHTTRPNTHHGAGVGDCNSLCVIRQDGKEFLFIDFAILVQVEFVYHRLPEENGRPEVSKYGTQTGTSRIWTTAGNKKKTGTGSTRTGVHRRGRKQGAGLECCAEQGSAQNVPEKTIAHSQLIILQTVTNLLGYSSEVP